MVSSSRDRILENGIYKSGNIVNFADEFRKKNSTKEMNEKKSSHSGRLLINTEGDKMDNDKIVEKYIEKVDRDQSDLKNDIRESERRTQGRLTEIEKRMDDRLNRIEDMMIAQSSKIDNMKDDLIEKMDSTQKWITGIAITTIIGIAAMVIAVLVA